MINRAIEFFKRHERHISSGALITGFIVDSLTLRRVDLLIENLALMTYIIIIASAIAFINFYEEGKTRAMFWQNLRPWALIAMQFAIGGLFSAFLVFYSRSASFVTSWPFLLVIVGQMIGNELLRDKYARVTFQVGILFFALFSYTTFAVPVLIGSIGWWVFLLSGAVSLLLIACFAFIIEKISPIRFMENKRLMITAVLGIYALLNIFYFTNIIPPIPLSLQEAGLYRSVSRQADGSYDLIARSTIFPVGATVYAYSSVFAPTRLNTSIVHHWQYFDPREARWRDGGYVSFPIVGGRDGGYRGYSVRDNLTAGLWRVDVETRDGKVVGRIKFKVQ